MIDIVFTYIHYLSIMVMVGCLIAEMLLLASRDGQNTVENLSRVDISYFLATGMVLLTGAVKTVSSYKGSMYFVVNPVFMLKVLLFLAVAGLSLIPTRHYAHWRSRARMDPGYRIPAADAQSTRRFVLSEALLVALIPLLAAMMARGIGS